MTPGSGSGSGSGFRRSRRAQSSTIGVLLVFALVIAGMGLTVSVGGQAITASQDRLGVSRAETSMTQFDSQAALVALGRSPGQRTRLPGGVGSGYVVDDDAGWVTVRYRNLRNGTDTTVVNRQPMGEVAFGDDGSEVAYQGGGVWRRTGEGSTMVSPPEFHYRNATLTFPLVRVRGDGPVGGTVGITDAGSTALYPNTSRDPAFSNPLENGRVTVRVHSEYYRGWGTYFETRTGGSVSYDHANDVVSVDLVVPGENPPIEGGIVTSPAGRLEIWNHAEADSYNSSNGPYGAFPEGDGTRIITDSDVMIHNHADLYGSVEASGRVTVANHGRVRGNVSHGGLSVARHGRVDGWTARNATVSAPSPVDGTIGDRLESARTTNDNDNASVDVDESTNSLENCASTCTLLPGTYYLDEIDLTSDETLRLATRRGRIDVVVDGDVTVDGENPASVDPEIRVVGDGRANLWVAGDVTYDQQGSASVAGDRAPMFWTFTRSNRTVDFQTHARYQGVMYGPGGEGGSGTRMVLNNHAAVFGALVGDVEFVSNHYSIHYDEALSSVEPVTVDTSVPALTFLHVSTNEVNVTDANGA